MGAWIETKDPVIGSFRCDVAPYVGAWIETGSAFTSTSLKVESHPTWVRGLKHHQKRIIPPEVKSHPTWVRGLKLHT